METTQTQQLFFNHIKSKLPSHISLVEEVAEILNISNDSAYRRIRGEKPISLDETHALCSKYHVSIDQLLRVNTNTVIFSFEKVDNLNKFLQFAVHNLGLFSMLQNPLMYYYSKDLPIFHFMPFPELRAFKFFFWKRTVIGYPELARQRFNGEEGDQETIDLAKKIDELYVKVPSTDIWNEESVNVTFSQIELYRQSNVFANKDIILKVYTQLEELVNHLELQAETGRKSLYNQPTSPNCGTYDAYINETLIGDNTIFVQADNRQIAFINHNGLNFISTQDNDFCDFTLKNLQNVIRKSTHISVVGEKERSMFFNTIRERIYERKKNLG
ncbi:MAG TPA: helix-turn-helix domain-containing protein [Mucilaginibacter sp.]|nr:helix-turn-helix domain-containing protein [Mucilaginibacter sp.]